MLAALNHPNIAQVYGVETSGAQPALVMELVSGRTLDETLGGGPLPWQDALDIARQIAAALDAAHERGIVHRDLKPANVKITDDGVVKVLDFGLAKAESSETIAAGGGVTASPTLTATATAMGVILGTAAYMAPEQAKGRPVDRRADVWAFGAVLFEMLSGRRAFDGDDASEVLAAVIRGEPPWDTIPESVPPAVRRLLRRCLEKDQRRRLRDIAEGMLQLDEGLTAPIASAPTRGRSLWQRSALALAGLVVAAAAISAYAALSLGRPTPGVIRFSTRPAQLILAVNPRPQIALMNDGRMIYLTQAGLFIKQPQDFDGVAIEGAELATTPFVSPDGEWLGFVQGSPPDNLLFKVPLRGGARTRIAESPERTYGADWGFDDTIVFGTVAGLFKVAAGSSTPVQVTKGGGTLAAAHSWPSFVGSSDLVLFSIGQEANAKLAAVTMATGAVTELGISGTSPRYLPTGHIAYATSDGVLWAVPFDADRIAIRGVPVPLESGVRVRLFSGSADFDVSDTGTLVYVAAEDDVRVPVWVDPRGVESPIPAEPRAYTYTRLSNGGERLVLITRERERDIWLWNFARPGLRPLVRNIGAVSVVAALWTADSGAIFFPLERENRRTIHRLNVDGSGQLTRVADVNRSIAPYSMTPDGSGMIVRDGDDIALLRLGGEGQLVTLVPRAINPALSPNGRWLAYDSTRSGTREVYVQPFPKLTDGEWPVSRGAGSAPVWSRDGREIFYVSRGRMTSVAVDDGATFSPSPPKDLFDASAYPVFGLTQHFDVAPDGRFLMLKRIDRSEPVIRVVFNWFSEVTARVKPR